MVDFKYDIVRNMKQRVRTPQFLNRVINVYDFTTLFSRLMMYRRAKSSLVQPKKEGEEETTYNMYNSMFIRIKEKNKLNDRKMKRILKRFYNISPTSTVEVMHTCMEYLSSLDGTIPRELFEDYLDEHGPHFSKKLCELAVSCMENADGSKHRYSKEEVKELLKRNGVTVKKASEYDCCFVANMAYADFFPEPLRNEFDIAMYVKKYIDDPDGYDGIAFSRYLADLKRTGTYIDWEEMI